MKSIVVFKWLMHPQDARVGADGSVDWRGVKLSASDDDPAAILTARDIAADGDEIIGLTIGDGDLAWAAARGAARTVVVTDALSDADSAAIGAVLAAGVKHIGGDVVLIGDSVWDYGVVVSMAAHLGWSTLANVLTAEKQGAGFRVTQKLGSETRVVGVAGPVVLATAASRAEQQVPGMKEVLAARKKPVEKITKADLGISGTGAATSLETKFPDTSPAKIIDGAEPAAAVEALMAALRMEGVL
jgi:electron transfer flavoprotein beta subunit